MMSGETVKHLDQISDQLQAGHAAVLVGAGFSRNADKIVDSVPSSPTWQELSNFFAEKLTADPQEQEVLQYLSPMVLAERVEAVYGRPVLDQLLLDHIREGDFLPSALHQKLLTLPWRDIFTTNYDTLLEQASEKITEKNFTFVLKKEDLVGSLGTTRIVKLHGSFPSHRPFIITSEDYRTYPRKFAPFVNTVQQSLLENTLCLIGFSGNDPNFEQWTGWIRDNLGNEYAPNIYLLTHTALSEAERELMRKKNIVPVDLSQITASKSPRVIYEATLDYLLERLNRTRPTEWEISRPLRNEQGQMFSLETATAVLRTLHQTYPGWLSVPAGRLDLLRGELREAEQVLVVYCAAEDQMSDWEMEYLYEYDWLRNKTLLPLFSNQLKLYQKILDRHPEEQSLRKYSVQLSILRMFRENGAWTEWETLHDKLCAAVSHFEQEQVHQLRWEECLCALARYQFQELKTKLDCWPVSASVPVWALRKAGLLAEYGELDKARSILQESILSIRRRMFRHPQVDVALLSLESAMMVLQEYISSAIAHSAKYEKIEEDTSHERLTRSDSADTRRRAFQSQYYAAWTDQNHYFVPRLEAMWVPFSNSKIRPGFDFGQKHSSWQIGSDMERIFAYSFLRFREETGLPFFLHSVKGDTKAACGAAERVALYHPAWSILTLVRADEVNAVETTITRAVLSTWSQEDADDYCQFYLGAVQRTEAELNPSDWLYRNCFARLAADVLPEILSELCSKCSEKALDQLFDLALLLYSSEKKLCYQKATSLMKRLINAYPARRRRGLVLRMLSLPIDEDELHRRFFDDPIKFVPTKIMRQSEEYPLPEIEQLFFQYRQSKSPQLLNRLLYGFCHGCLTKEQERELSSFLWEGRQLSMPKGWSRTLCLDLPAPHDIQPARYLGNVLTKDIEGYVNEEIVRPNNDRLILKELQAAALEGNEGFSDQQIAVLLYALCYRLQSLLPRLSVDKGIGNLVSDQFYDIGYALWFLTAGRPEWAPSGETIERMRDILETYREAGICPFGLLAVWNPILDVPFDMEKELTQCLRSHNEQCAYGAYESIAYAARYSIHSLLSEEELRSGVTILAQKIMWGAPGQLDSALQAAITVLNYRPDLVTEDILEALLTELALLRQQTLIDANDAMSNASEKGRFRMSAAALAKQLRQAGFYGDRPDVLEDWAAISGDPNEFAEIRNV